MPREERTHLERLRREPQPSPLIRLTSWVWLCEQLGWVDGLEAELSSPDRRTLGHMREDGDDRAFAEAEEIAEGSVRSRRSRLLAKLRGLAGVDRSS